MPAGGLIVKQVRQVPTSDRKQTPFLVNSPTQFEVYTGEFDLFDRHRCVSPIIASSPAGRSKH